MKFHIITIFPDSFQSYFSTSIMKRAQEKGNFIPILYNLCDYSVVNTRRVDDRPYGGLPGTILSPEPLARLLDEIISKEGKLGIIYLSAKGSQITQDKLENLAKKNNDLIIICGHYEGIDQRIIELYGIKELSLGKYVLSGGELAAMVLIDGIVRLIPGTISEESLYEESYSRKLKGKKEYPQYTRPSEFRGKKVPEELLSGNPKTIGNWKNKFL